MARSRHSPRPCSLLLALACWAAIPAQAAGSIQSFTKQTDLHFGDFTVLGSCSNCTITIDPATGNRSSSGGVLLRASNGGQRGQYAVRMNGCGQGCSYTASVAPASLNMVTSGGTMTVTSFTVSQTALVSNGNTLYVGGTLRIPSVNVTAGSYSTANYTVTATP